MNHLIKQQYFSCVQQSCCNSVIEPKNELKLAAINAPFVEPKFFIVICPNCGGSIFIFEHEIACRIFRHATLKVNNQPINPHAPKEVCEELLRNGKIWGCGKPFYFDGTNIKTCDYI